MEQVKKPIKVVLSSEKPLKELIAAIMSVKPEVPFARIMDVVGLVTPELGSYMNHASNFRKIGDLKGSVLSIKIFDGVIIFAVAVGLDIDLYKDGRLIEIRSVKNAADAILNTVIKTEERAKEIRWLITTRIFNAYSSVKLVNS